MVECVFVVGRLVEPSPWSCRRVIASEYMRHVWVDSPELGTEFADCCAGDLRHVCDEGAVFASGGIPSRTAFGRL